MPPPLIIMVVSARLDYVRQRIVAGDCATVSLLPQPAGKLKVKIALTPSCTPLSSLVQQMLFSTLDALHGLQAMSVAVDRGHKTSAGTSKVAMWMQPVPPPATWPELQPTECQLRAAAPPFIPVAAPVGEVAGGREVQMSVADVVVPEASQAVTDGEMPLHVALKCKGPPGM